MLTIWGCLSGIAALDQGVTPGQFFASGEEGGWWDFQDLSTVFEDSAGTTPATVGNPIGLIQDQSGNGNGLIQPTTDAKPILRQTGSLYYAEFDGVNDRLVATMALGTEYDRITCAQQDTWTNTYEFYSCGPDVAELRQNGTSPELVVRHGNTPGSRTSDLALGVRAILTEKFTTSGGTLSVNRGTATSPTNGTATAATHLSVGGRQTGSLAGNIRFFGGTTRETAFSVSDQALVEQFFADKNGITLP